MNEHYNYMTKYPEYKQSDRGVTMNVKKTLVPMISCFVIAFCLFYNSARPLSEYGSVSPRGPIVSRVTIEPTGDNVSPYVDMTINTVTMDAIYRGPQKSG